jgi:hypothetical protein
MGSTLTSYDALLKERYIDSNKVERLTYPENTLLGMLEKRGDTGMVGDVMPVPIISALPQGVGGVFATAQAAVSNITAAKWQISAGDYYGVVHIGDKVLQASRTNQGAFLDDKTAEIDGLYEQMGEMLSIHTWGNGGGKIGQRASAATNVITLVNYEDSQNFEVGMTVVASAADGATVTDSARTGSTTVTAIDRANGQITLANAGAISSFGDLDYLFRAGDFAGDTLIVTLKGVQAFITGTDSPGALWSVTAATRLTDLQRYSGCRVAITETSGKGYDERIKVLLAWMGSVFKSKSPTAGFLNPLVFQVLETIMQSKGVRAMEDESTKFGYMKIDIMGSGGRIPIYCDRHCPRGIFFAFRMEDWWISSMGELMRAQNGDGFEMLRRAVTTDYEYRLISYPILANRAPKNSGRVSLTA